MERPSLRTIHIHHLVALCNLVCVVILVTLGATPLSALTTPSTSPDTSLFTSVQPSFTSTANPESLPTLQTRTASLDSDVSPILPSSDGHSSDVLTVNLSLSTTAGSASLSHSFNSSHVKFESSPVTGTETLDALPVSISTSSLLLESTYPPYLLSVVATSASNSLDTGGMNTSTSPDSSVRTTVSSNETQNYSSSVGVVSTSTLAPGFGNGSCSGNNTGCPEYNGKQDLALSTPAIIGIAVGAAVLVIILVCLALFMCRRRRTLSGSKADLSTYWDDNVTLSYINGHLDYPKDASDEMVSLDNDSFLNSLDSMSFSNMWVTETAKHTNF